MKNYTSTVPAARSLMNIEKVLSDSGALNISKQFEEGKVKSLCFQIDHKGEIVSFMFPANVKACEKVLLRMAKRLTPTTRKKLEVQAERTAWKILHEWVAIQMTLIQLEQADFLEVFLPYVLTDNGTLYKKLQSENGFERLLLTK